MEFVSLLFTIFIFQKQINIFVMLILLNIIEPLRRKGGHNTILGQKDRIDSICFHSP